MRMFVKDDNQLMRMTWLVISIFTCFRLIYAGSFLLTPDEANYWQWSRHLAWSYYDQTPMIAWTIRLTTFICGHTELGVRLPSVIAITVVSVYLVLMAQRWFGWRVALHTTFLSQSIFLLNIGGLLATADGLQAAAWAAAAYHTARAYEAHQWRQWLWAGLWFGFGMLSKYTMILFLPCIFLYGLFNQHHRIRLTSLKPYVGLLLGLTLFSPVIVWNAANKWSSIRHVAYIGGANQAFSIHWQFLADYLASQAALLTPVVFIVICIAWWRVAWRQYPHEDWIYAYLCFTSLPVIVGFAILSLHTRIYGNWAGTGYVTAVILAASLIHPLSNSDQKQIKGVNLGLWRLALSSSYLLTGLILLHVVWPFLPIPHHLDRSIAEIEGWDHLGQKVAHMHRSMPQSGNTFLFGLQYQFASELAFYVPGQPQTASINRWNRPNVYDYWVQDADLIGKDAIGVTSNMHSRKRLLEVFEQVDLPEALSIYRQSRWPGSNNTKLVKHFYIYRCYGFKGGLRWQPSDRNDIRAAKFR